MPQNSVQFDSLSLKLAVNAMRARHDTSEHVHDFKRGITLQARSPFGLKGKLLRMKARAPSLTRTPTRTTPPAVETSIEAVAAQTIADSDDVDETRTLHSASVSEWRLMFESEGVKRHLLTNASSSSLPFDVRRARVGAIYFLERVGPSIFRKEFNRDRLDWAQVVPQPDTVAEWIKQQFPGVVKGAEMLRVAPRMSIETSVPLIAACFPFRGRAGDLGSGDPLLMHRKTLRKLKPLRALCRTCNFPFFVALCVKAGLWSMEPSAPNTFTALIAVAYFLKNPMVAEGIKYCKRMAKHGVLGDRRLTELQVCNLRAYKIGRATRKVARALTNQSYDFFVSELRRLIAALERWKAAQLQAVDSLLPICIPEASPVDVLVETQRVLVMKYGAEEASRILSSTRSLPAFEAARRHAQVIVQCRLVADLPVETVIESLCAVDVLRTRFGINVRGDDPGPLLAHFRRELDPERAAAVETAARQRAEAVGRYISADSALHVEVAACFRLLRERMARSAVLDKIIDCGRAEKTASATTPDGACVESKR